MKVSRKKFFISLGAVMVAGSAILSNPVKYIFKKKKTVSKITVKENRYAVKRNSAGTLNG